MEKYIYDENNGLWYELQGDYYIPCLKLPDEEQVEIGVWGQRHLEYIKHHRKGFYTSLVLDCKLNRYLADINKQSKEMFDILIYFALHIHKDFGTKIFIEAITIHAVVWLGGGAFGWRTIAIIYAVLGLIVNTISVFSVKELPEADECMEEERAEESKLTFAKSLKLLLKNKYYVIICISYIFTQIYASVIGIGTYYAKYILGNEGLFSDLSLAINITMVVALTVLPIVIQKMGGMYKLNVLGYLVAALGRVGVLVAAYMGSFPLMLAFTAVSTLGIAPLQGDLNALIASCSEYTTLTTGYRLDGMMYSCSSLGIKISIDIAYISLLPFFQRL